MTRLIDDETLGALLALLAHDLRNPLSALHSNVGFLETLGGLDQDGREAVRDGLVSCEALSHMIDNIDLLGNHLRGAETPCAATVALAALVRRVVSTCRSAAESHGVALIVSDDLARTEAVVLGDADMLGRALGNLVRNSIQLSAGTDVRLSHRLRGSGAVVVVEDGGSSPPADLRDTLFTAPGQVRAKSEPAGRYSRALGLYAARLAADATGASVRAVDPSSGDGNAFELTIPLS